MEYGRSLSECKSSSSSYWLAILILAVLVVPQAWGGCLEEERKALLQIKASLDTTYGPVGNVLLPTWVNHSSRGNCCDWERVTCDNTSGRVTELNLSNIRQISYEDYINKIWPLNVSLFLHFKELTSLDLSWDFLDNGIEKTGLAKLSSLKKLTVLDLSSNELENNSIFSSLGAISSLKILDVSDNSLGGRFPAHDCKEQTRYYYKIDVQEVLKYFHDTELAALENLEVLDLTYGEFHGSFRVQGFEIHSKFLKLETLNLGYNDFNESLIASLSALPSLKVLNLEGNPIISFPTEDLANLRNLERLDLSASVSEGTLTVQGCKSLSRLTRLHNIALGGNVFNKSIISCLSALPSLKILNLRGSDFGSSFPTQELSALKELTMLDVSKSDLDSLESSGTMYKLEHLILDYNNFNKDIRWSRAAFPSLRFLSLSYCNMKGVFSAEELPNLEVLILSVNQLNGLQGSFHRLEVLDLSQNSFVGSIPSSIQSLSSLKALSLAGNELNGSLHSQGLCELKNLQELDLSNNTFEGNLPPCLSSLSSLKLFDLSSNQFSGKLPPSLISNLTSLEYVDLSHNKFEGSFSFSLFSNHTKLEVVEFIGDNDKFEIETEEPSGWIPTFQLKVLVLSNCNLNSSVPSFLLHQNGLRVLDLSHNSLHGWFPNWLIENNTALELFNARNNSFGGSIHMPPYRNVNLWWLDMSGNQISGSIPADIGKNLPYITHLNLTGNALNGSLPLSIGDLSELEVLDLSNNNFTGEVPRRLVTSIPQLQILKLSNNRFEGEVLSRKFDMNLLNLLMLDKNRFTGGLSSEITNNNLFTGGLNRLDISDNSFSGVIPRWMSNLTTLNTLVLRNNKFEGQFPCGIATFRFLDISQNFFSGSLPSCPNLKYVEHLHLEGNRFTGSIPKIFHDLPYVLTLDLGNNNLSGEIPGFLGELHSLRILLLRGNNFSGQFPNQLCQLNKVSIIDISSNNLSGSIPSCLRNITGPIELAFKEEVTSIFPRHSFFHYRSILQKDFGLHDNDYTYKIQDEVQFITKRRFDTFTGGILDYMSGLDLSCNNLTGEIPEELGLLTHIHALNLSHNHLTGPIPWHFSNLKNIESLDLSWNALSGKVPSEFIDLGFLAVFSVAHNNLSGRLPEMKGQFGTFSQDSYEANPFLCGPPLEKKCTLVPNQVLETPSEDEEKWYDIDMLYFYASFASTWFVFLLGFAGLLYINPYWLRRWLYFIEECIYSCYYFLCDSMRKLFHARP